MMSNSFRSSSAAEIEELLDTLEGEAGSSEACRQTAARLRQKFRAQFAEADRLARQLRVLAAQVTLVEQRERHHLACVLHEHFQQLLAGAKFSLDTIKGQAASVNLLPTLQEVDKVLGQAIEESRMLAIELCPLILHHASMSQVLYWLARWMRDKHGLTVSVRADDQVDPQDEPLREVLFQAVRELLFNVVKHAQTNQAMVQMSRAEEQVRIVVSDHGVGFDAAGLSGRRGTCFGLADMRRRLELLGGRMEVDSHPGRGTRVTLLTPRCLSGPATGMAEMSEDAKAGSAGESAQREKIRVLLADDHAVVRDGLSRLLQLQPDMQVVGQAADGLQAVQMALQLRPDIVLMDVSMPGLSGVDITRRITQELPGIRVIGLSMHKQEDVADRMTAAGAAAYVTKTAPPEKLIATIREHAARQLQ